MHNQSDSYRGFNHYNGNIITQQTQARYHMDQTFKVADCVNKFKDFLGSIEAVAPEYQSQVTSMCWTLFVNYSEKRKNNRL